MAPSESPTRHETLAQDLIRLLHQGASAEDYARRLAEIDALPSERTDKSALAETVHLAMAVRNRLEQREQRENGLLALIESAQDLSGRLDLNVLLSTIVARARKLLGSDMAWLSVLDGGGAEFRALIIDGAVSRSTQSMVAPHGRGVVSVVMASRLPFSTPDYLHDTRFNHDPALDDIFRNEGISSLLGVPLIWEDEVIGLLFLADRYPRMHSAQSISILCTLATHGAVALKNARDFERVSAALARADADRAELERHLRGIQAAADAHEQMTSLLAKGVPLSALCELVARLFDASLLVLDEAGQIVSRGTSARYAGTLAAAYQVHGEHSVHLVRALRQSREMGRSVAAFEQAGECCRVMAVIGGSDVLGSIALFHSGALDDVAVRTLERSSSVIGIVLLSQERMEAARSRSASALLRAVLAPRQEAPALLTDRAERVGLDLAQPLVLLLVEMEGPGAAYAARRMRAHAPGAGLLIDEIDGLFVALCHTARGQDLKQELAAWARREPVAAHRGVLSRPIVGFAQLPSLYATLRRALVVLGRIGVCGEILGQNELALYSTLFETHDQASLAEFLNTNIGALVTHDRKRGADLAQTLLSYYDCHQNAKLTAHTLGIHVNTVRQRLATVEDLIGRNYRDNATRSLEIHMALRLWRLGTLEPTPAPP